uniref:Protein DETOXIFICATION n=1 Tax=Aegilops tauschii TaxID=37682 RepID=M8BRR5_AEGTA
MSDAWRPRLTDHHQTTTGLKIFNKYVQYASCPLLPHEFTPASSPQLKLVSKADKNMQNPSVDEQPLLVAGSVERDENVAASEAKRLLRLAGPLVASGLLQCALQLVSVMFVGHLGELHLAGASLATSLANVTGFSLLAGMASALDTLCGQAFGARQYHLLGVYKQRAMLVLALACVPIALVWTNTTRILLFLGQDPAIAAEAGAYARWLIPSLVPYVPLTCHIRFLQTQSIVVPVMASSAVTSLSHVLVCWALVHKAGMGSKGAALARAVSYCTNLSILSMYTRLSGACKRTWKGFSMEAFKELRQFAELAFPSAMMVQFQQFFALSIFPSRALIIESCSFNTGALMFMVPSGLCTAIRFWGYVYSNEEEVVAYIARMIPVLAMSFFMDGIHTSLAGVLTGCGEQKIGARVNLVAFYLAGIPLAVLLAFALHFNGMGLWLGIVCGSLTKLLLLMWIVLSINWEKEAIKVKDMVLGSSLPVA